MFTFPKLLVALVMLMVTAPAFADVQPLTRIPIPACNVFEEKSDGTWSPNRPVILNGPTGQISLMPGVSFRSGSLLLGPFDLGAQLKRQCRGEGAQS
jgi:hypothetical protein